MLTVVEDDALLDPLTARAGGRHVPDVAELALDLLKSQDLSGTRQSRIFILCHRETYHVGGPVLLGALAEEQDNTVLLRAVRQALPEEVGIELLELGTAGTGEELAEKRVVHLLLLGVERVLLGGAADTASEHLCDRELLDAALGGVRDSHGERRDADGLAGEEVHALELEDVIGVVAQLLVLRAGVRRLPGSLMQRLLPGRTCRRG